MDKQTIFDLVDERLRQLGLFPHKVPPDLSVNYQELEERLLEGRPVTFEGVYGVETGRMEGTPGDLQEVSGSVRREQREKPKTELVVTVRGITWQCRTDTGAYPERETKDEAFNDVSDALKHGTLHKIPDRTLVIELWRLSVLGTGIWACVHRYLLNPKPRDGKFDATLLEPDA